MPNGLGPGCGLVIALGGDGTILRALQLAMPHQVGVLGINFGTVGFLADMPRDDFGPALRSLARGEATDRRTHGAGRHDRDRAAGAAVIAFNDVVVARRPRPRHGAAAGRGRRRADPRNCAATASSSPRRPGRPPTTSARAARRSRRRSTPSSSRRSPPRAARCGRSCSTAATSSASTTEPASAPLSAEIDGRTIHDLPTPASVEVRAAPHKARLVRTRPRTFYEDFAGRL